MERVTCSGCSLLCGDITIKTDGLYIDEVFGACKRGKERFDSVTAKNRITSPLIRKNGKLEKATWEVALNKICDLIRNSKKPLLYGFSTVTCEAQLKGIELAQRINGFIDSNSSICQGKTLKIARDTGITFTTLSDAINKADLLVFWGFNPAESIPRLLNKVVFSRGKFRMTGREIKTVVIIDPIKIASFGIFQVRDISLQIKPNADWDLIKTIKTALETGNDFPSEGAAGIDKSDLKRFYLNLTEAENGIIFIGQGLLNPLAGVDLIRELLELVNLLNKNQKKGRISIFPVGGHYNMLGFNHVALSFTGKSHSVRFRDNKIMDEETTLVSTIQKGEFDFSLIVGTDPISHLPHSLSSKMASKPIVVIDNRSSATTHVADVVLPSAISGVESAGLAFRLDHVPIELKKIVNPPSNVRSDVEILTDILTKLNNLEER
ncbi:MAG: formylmethanofuran dehydrogenase subunit B [Promethearchaeota archaeon]